MSVKQHFEDTVGSAELEMFGQAIIIQLLACLRVVSVGSAGNVIVYSAAIEACEEGRQWQQVQLRKKWLLKAQLKEVDEYFIQDIHKESIKKLWRIYK